MLPVLCSLRPHVLSHKKVGAHSWCFSWSPSRLLQPKQCYGVPRRRVVHTNTHSNTVELSDAALVWLMLQRVAVATGLVHVLTEYVADITLCEGHSMLPTLALSGDIILVEKVSTRSWNKWGLRDGESAFGRTQASRRRQDEYEMHNVWHETALNDSCQEELSWQQAWQQVWSPISTGDVVIADHPHITGSICKRLIGLPGDRVIERSTGKIQRVPDGHVWLEGDNARMSKDSRCYGPVPAALVKGRVVARVWPIRGSAWKQRMRSSSSTVLPAGYRGEHIVKPESEVKTRQKT